MEQLGKITNIDKVTLALLLEEGKAKIEDLQFHLTLTKRQIREALGHMVQNDAVLYETHTGNYQLL